MTNDINRRKLLLGAALSIIGGSSRVLADDPPVPADPRRRLGVLLAADPFQYKGCIPYFEVVGDNETLKLEFVNEMGDLVLGIVQAIWADDPVAVASRSRGKDDHKLLSGQERCCYRMLWAISELIAMARGWKVDSKAPLDVRQLREAVANLDRWTGDVELRTTMTRVIDTFFPTSRPNASSGGGGDGGGNGPPPPGGDGLPPPEDGEPLREPQVAWIARFMDLFHITGIEFIFLMKILADQREENKKAKIRRFQEAFSVQLTRELGRPVAPAEAARARRMWAGSNMTLPWIAHVLDQRA